MRQLTDEELKLLKRSEEPDVSDVEMEEIAKRLKEIDSKMRAGYGDMDI